MCYQVYDVYRGEKGASFLDAQILTTADHQLYLVRSGQRHIRKQRCMAGLSLGTSNPIPSTTAFSLIFYNFYAF